MPNQNNICTKHLCIRNHHTKLILNIFLIDSIIPTNINSTDVFLVLYKVFSDV